ncbi:hypothetical protein [Herbaspirillum sp. SJZ107]|uniref:hypothetical protein n=1 Tax=Herbaspirillum sp. SJZ107 TaxID=2572881 RepID=UPI00115021CD|nr:hypothetical protein [Herbaspirillum sp. SJZ107]TQK03454.1 hypothetical protein FBX97_5022 [Herbaspirillum sp. SJZ107]
MSDLLWYLPLEHCTSLDDIRSLWHGLLERCHMAPEYNVPRYQDAMLAFLGNSALAPRLKLAAVLACGSAFNFDFRLAAGLLQEQIDELDTPWPEAVAARVGMNGPALPVQTRDAWLGAFVAGRLAGLRETFTHDGLRAEHWRARFWILFLEMACRHADGDGVQLALGNGADPRADGHAAVLTPAQGVHLRFLSEAGHLTPERSNSDYERILLQLVEGGLPHGEMLRVALAEAAGADNTDMLGFLLAQGADLRADGARALEAAARSMAVSALGWLLDHGVPVDAGDCAALVAGVASLDETTVETLLAAGADLHNCSALALRTALTSRPYELYSCESDLIDLRADMIGLLLRHGAGPDRAALTAALQDAADAAQVIEEAAKREDLSADDAELLRRLVGQASSAD